MRYVTSPTQCTKSETAVTISPGPVYVCVYLSFFVRQVPALKNCTPGVLTLSGPSSLANYQAALRSVSYRDSNAAEPSGTRTVSFVVNDGAAASNLSNVESRTIAVSNNSPPTAGPVSASTNKSTAIDINVLASTSGPAGDTLSVTSVGTAGTKGTVSINANGTVHYDPNGQFQSLTQGQTATDTFTYTVSDGFQTSSPGTVTVTVTGSSDIRR